MDDILELLDRKLHWGQDGVRMKLAGVAALQNELSRASDEYNNAMIMSQRPDPTLEAVKGQIKEQLSALNKLVQVKKILPLSKKPCIRCYRKLCSSCRMRPSVN